MEQAPRPHRRSIGGSKTVTQSAASPAPGRTSRVATGLALLVILGMIAAAIPVALRQAAAHRLQGAAQAVIRDPTAAGVEAQLDRRLSACGPRCPAWGLLAASAAYLEQALNAGSPGDRARLRASAEQTARRALERSPASPEAWTQLALAEALAADGALTGPAIAALRTAYASAPFHRPVAEPRILLVAGNWAASPEDLRAHVRSELAWLAGLDESASTRLLARLPDGFVKEHLQLELARSLSESPGSR